MRRLPGGLLEGGRRHGVELLLLAQFILLKLELHLRIVLLGLLQSLIDLGIGLGTLLGRVRESLGECRGGGQKQKSKSRESHHAGHIITKSGPPSLRAMKIRP